MSLGCFKQKLKVEKRNRVECSMKLNQSIEQKWIVGLSNLDGDGLILSFRESVSIPQLGVQLGSKDNLKCPPSYTSAQLR